ncbi:bifunctional diguanylate cyclase/phosphodiesterase [Deinococcus sonorensis]|uniref:Bifunctional diguanylate cyclase/phosphodiesterase n=2 Tax=Deinococcus sonorensis TaxID=309891 RepID=A0AAU7U5X5_9DEIO
MKAPATNQDSQVHVDLAWHRPLLLALPGAALAFLIGVLLDGPSGQHSTFDQFGYPAAFALLVVLSAVLWWRPAQLNRVVTLLVVAMSSFFLSKLVYILFVLPQTVQVQLEMTETFFWVPALQVLSFYIPQLKGARLASISFFGGFLLVSVLALLRDHWTGTALGIRYSLLELNFANVMLFAVTYTFIGFKERYAREVAQHDTLHHLLVTDVLTNLPNRQQLQTVMASSIAARRPFAVLFIDLDGFKLINDTLGHRVGDQALQETARRLTSQEAFAARLSGDEFVMLVWAKEDAAMTVARTLVERLAQPMHLSGQLVTMSASIGVSTFPEDGHEIQALLQHADSAMYTVKAAGKQGVRRFAPDTEAAIERLRALEAALHQALHNGELSLVYQPICSLQDGVIRKFEALLRWTHPAYGPIAPVEFISIAERTGQILPLGAWVLREACRAARGWAEAAGRSVAVSVNVSALQVTQPNFVDLVREALNASALPASALEIELTESAVMRQLDVVKSALRDLQRLGVRVAIDDFGAGYSSLSYLRDLPINAIKIDRSFVQDLGSPRRAPQFVLALIEAVIGIAGTLELQVVAEGIETPHQLAMLQDLGCDLGQGYLLARPGSAEVARTLLQHQP